jgi:hypothetical protein
MWLATLPPVTASDESWRLMWMYLATGISLWMLGLFWTDAFDVDVVRAPATVVNVPACLPFMECSVEVEYRDAGGKIQKAWITAPHNRIMNEGDEVQVAYGPYIRGAVLDERRGKPPKWVGRIVCWIGTLCLVAFVALLWLYL